MKSEKFLLMTLALIAIQAGFLNFIDFSQFITILFIPAVVLCLPLSMSTSLSLVIAFLLGFVLDFCSHGVLGLTSCALLPATLFRKPVISLVCGEEVFAREESLSFKKQGLFKIAVSLTFFTAIFLFVYILADGAGMRPFWFNFVRFILSLITSTLAGLFCVNILSK